MMAKIHRAETARSSYTSVFSLLALAYMLSYQVYRRLDTVKLTLTTRR